MDIDNRDVRARERDKKKEPKPPKLYDIPPQARARRCYGKTCGRLIYMVDNKPLSPNPDFGGYAPSHQTAGKGVLHYVDCPDRKDFKKKA